jgi:hypothetical protein
MKAGPEFPGLQVGFSFLVHSVRRLRTAARLTIRGDDRRDTNVFCEHSTGQAGFHVVLRSFLTGQQ